MTQPISQNGHPDAAFIERAFREAMELVQETAGYLEQQGLQDRDQLDEAARAAFTGESLRLTTRLMQAVSWLMVQRAVSGGEMTATEALASKRRLGGREICLGAPMPGAEALPNRLQGLLDQSRQIYERLSRLEDRLLKGDNQPNPVHGLLRKLDL